MKKNENNWWFALLLTTPMVIFFMGYLFNHDASLTPTGFIQYDNVSYVAYAKQYTEGSSFSLFYSNPFNDSANYSGIYFQLQTIFFSVLLKLGIPIGCILIPFTFVCSIICFRLLIAIYDRLFTSNKLRIISIWLLAWGGGLLTLSGFIAQQILGGGRVTSIFHFDPGAGWWGLNLGRSLFFSCEAFYHALFLGVVYNLLKQKWRNALILSFALSVSHPFTGLELLSIVCGWAFIDRYFWGNKAIPTWFVATEIFILLFHLFYYLLYLNQFEEHRSVSSQYALNWRLQFFNIIPAYCIVGLLSAISFVKISSFSIWLKSPSNRLLLFWFALAFTLANHELFMKPMQPLHFTRGYIWTSLFLIGLPGLHYLINIFSVGFFRKIMLVVSILLFFSDNFLWIYFKIESKAKQISTSYINEELKTIFTKLNEESNNKALLISGDKTISYLATVYSNLNPLISHPFTTPFAKQKTEMLQKFLEKGTLDSTWKGRSIFLVFRKNNRMELERSKVLPFSSQRILETASYLIYVAKYE